jgi:hypothetical protein
MSSGDSVILFFTIPLQKIQFFVYPTLGATSLLSKWLLFGSTRQLGRHEKNVMERQGCLHQDLALNKITTDKYSPMRVIK